MTSLNETRSNDVGKTRTAKDGQRQELMNLRKFCWGGGYIGYRPLRSTPS
jgi:hypothetical protein